MIPSLLVACALVAAPASSAVQGGEVDLTAPPRLDQVPTELHAKGAHFEVRSLWRSERGLGLYAHDALRVCEAAALEGLARGDGTAWPEGAPPLVVGVTGSPKGLREMVEEAPPQPLYLPAVVDGERTLPAVAVWPRIHDRTLFGVGLPAPTRRQVALVAGDAVAGRMGRSGAARVAEALHLSQVALETTGGAWGVADDPWTSGGLVALRERLAEVRDAGEQTVLLAALASAAVPRTGAPSTLQAGEAYQATAEEMAALLLLRAGGDAGVALEELQRLAPRWRVVAGAFGRHPYGWQTSAPARHDTSMLSAAPTVGDAYVLETEFFALSGDLRTPPQADVLFGERDGDLFLLACNSVEGIYLFRRTEPGGPWQAVAERKDAKVPVGERIAVRVEVEDGVINARVGGVELPSVQVGDRPLGGCYGLGAHQGSTVLFKPPTVQGR